VTWHWIETADHGFKPLKSSGLTPASALAGVADAVVEFVTSLQ
jgi:predicted alpha/beta-hydrolase family hydrolase